MTQTHPTESGGKIDCSPLFCRCGWQGEREELKRTEEIEIVHPANKNNPRCTLTDQAVAIGLSLRSVPSVERFSSPMECKYGMG